MQCLAYRADGRHILAADTHHRVRLIHIVFTFPNTSSHVPRSYNFEELSDTPVIQEDHAIMSFITDNSDRYALLNIATQGVHMWDIQAR